MTRYALKFTRNGASHLYVYDGSELKQARRKLHLLRLFKFKDARLTNYHGKGHQSNADMVEQPTPEEQAQEAAYYAHLEAQMAAPAAVVTPDDYDDDGGYCGPTCGRFGNW